MVIFIIILMCLLLYIVLLSLRSDYDKCYSNMENEGIAVFGMCGGVVGGDKGTEFLNHKCVGCPHYICFEKENKK